MTTNEALAAVFEAAAYAIENDDDYVQEEVLDCWNRGTQMLAGKKIVVLDESLTKEIMQFALGLADAIDGDDLSGWVIDSDDIRSKVSLFQRTINPRNE